eukprot:CAMPEP_0170595146 /NCGR_PEP_ID=MMETSP0224-20130122/14396_1 /TAXON_ID=285029 /ORGANISM="Togula jolla, Strain CCCM 725" /LENGTH=632 /DNA_ID=CAMNT_0010919287 /DNA_START=66 /DNA_END=1964 /DNA_ORIENTATION=-
MGSSVTLVVLLVASTTWGGNCLSSTKNYMVLPMTSGESSSRPSEQMFLQRAGASNMTEAGDKEKEAEVETEVGLLETEVGEMEGEGHEADVGSNSSVVGSDWTEKEALIVLAKLYYIFANPSSVAKQLYSRDKPCYDCITGSEYPPTKPCRQKGVLDEWRPTASKFLRLGFHDCLKYEDGSGGCDGCLSFHNMFNVYGDAEKLSMPDVMLTDNNNLAYAADVLEELYTTVNFPRNSPKLRKSLRKSGKSRADLWAFATQAAVHHALVENNKACKGEKDFETNGRCGHVYRHISTGFPCIINMQFSMKFFSGRQDCAFKDKPKERSWYRRRSFETARHEVHPNPHGGGAETSQFFADWFNFSRRETVAIMGAHALGGFHGTASLFKYDWTRGQAHILNNQYYRALVKSPSKMSSCAFPPRFTGGPQGVSAPTGWYVRPTRKSEHGGPFLWFHYYKRCPDCLNGKNVETEGGQFFRSDFCCQECATKTVETINKGCYQEVTKDETATNADLGLHIDFKTGAGGIPLSCDNFTKGRKKWSTKAIIEGKDRFVDFYTTEPNCPLQKLDDGLGTLAMHEVVELYAADQQLWIEDFVRTLEKMLSNGYSKHELRRSFNFDGVNCYKSPDGFACYKPTD